MPNMKCLSLTVQKLKRRLKLTTNRQTDGQTDRQTNKQTDRTKNNMPPIIRSGGIKIMDPCERFFSQGIHMCNMKALPLLAMAKV